VENTHHITAKHLPPYSVSIPDLRLQERLDTLQ
jgi:hypothetical protein